MGTKRAIESDRTVAAILKQASCADTFLFTSGQRDVASAHVENGYVTAFDTAELRARGAVGDLLGGYIDAGGNIVDPQLDARTVGVELDRVRAAPRSIFVTAGAAKHDIARTVVSNGLCSILVTDESTAPALLEEI